MGDQTSEQAQAEAEAGAPDGDADRGSALPPRSDGDAEGSPASPARSDGDADGGPALPPRSDGDADRGPVLPPRPAGQFRRSRRIPAPRIVRRAARFLGEHWKRIGGILIGILTLADAANGSMDLFGRFEDQPAHLADGTATQTSPSAAGGASPGSPGATAGASGTAEPSPPELIDLDGTPRALAADADHVWVVTADQDLVVRIAAGSGQAERAEPLDATPRSVVRAAGGVWVVTDDRTVRLDPETLRPRHETGDVVDDADDVDGRHVAVAADGDGSVWLVTSAGANAGLFRLDPGDDEGAGVGDSDDGDSGDGGVEVDHVLDILGEPTAIAARAGTVWVAMDDGQVRRVDVAARASELQAEVGGPIGGMAVAGEHLWVTSPSQARLDRLRVDGRGEPVDIDLSEAAAAPGNPQQLEVTEPQAVVATGDTVWTADRASGAWARISGPRAAIVGVFPPLGTEPVALAWVDGILWTALRGDRAVARTPLPHGG